MALTSAFKRLWAVSIFTNLADGLAMSAFPLLAVSLTRDPILISMIGALTMLPWLLFAMPIGAIVDVVNKKIALSLANGLRAVLAALLSLSIGLDVITIKWLLLFAFLAGVCEVLADTTTQTLIPTIVSDDDRVKANSRLEITFTIIQNFIGAPIGAFIYTIAIIIPFLSTTVGYAFAALICLRIPVEHKINNKKIEFASIKADIREGISYLVNHRMLRRIVIVTTLIGFSSSFARATEILFWLDELELDPKKLGLLLSSMGVISLLSAVIAPRTTEKLGQGMTLTISMFLTSLATLISGFMPNIWWFLLPAAITVGALTHWNIVLMAAYQKLIPQELYGKIHGTRRSLIWGTMPLAAFLGGVVSKIDLRVPWHIGGAIMLAVTCLNWNFIKRMGNGEVDDEIKTI